MAKFEILIQRPKCAGWVQSATSGIIENYDCVTTNSYVGNSKWLVICGWGNLINQQAFQAHRSSNRPVLILDMDYLTRIKSRYRISVNQLHPWAQLRLANQEDRLSQHNIVLEDWHDPEGHILLLGIAPKSLRAYNYKIHEWENRQIQIIKTLFPNRTIVYRPKPTSPTTITGTIDGSHGDITKWLKGCAVALVHHSNVAIECAIYGIPCVAEDGVGRAVYSNKLSTVNPTLTKKQRLEFLNQVAWFSWDESESTQMIAFASHINKNFILENVHENRI